MSDIVMTYEAFTIAAVASGAVVAFAGFWLGDRSGVITRRGLMADLERAHKEADVAREHNSRLSAQIVEWRKKYEGIIDNIDKAQAAVKKAEVALAKAETQVSIEKRRREVDCASLNATIAEMMPMYQFGLKRKATENSVNEIRKRARQINKAATTQPAKPASKPAPSKPSRKAKQKPQVGGG